jgi:WD40 repeat protein
VGYQTLREADRILNAKRPKRLLGPIVLIVFFALAFIYLWPIFDPHIIPSCFDDAPDLQAFLSDSSNEQRGPDLLRSPRITSDNVHELVKRTSFGTVDGRVTALTISPDDTVTAAVSFNGSIDVFHLMTEETVVISGPEGLIYSLAISPSNNVLAIYGSDGFLRLFDTHEGTQIAQWDIGIASYEKVLSFVSPHELIFSTGKYVYLCNLVSKQNRKLFDVPLMFSLETGGSATLWEFVLTHDRSHLIYRNDGDNDSTGIPEVAVWDLDSNTKSQSFTHHETLIDDITLSSNDQRLASIGIDGVVNLIELAGNTTLPSISTPRMLDDYRVALNWDGSLVFVTNQENGNLSIWDAETGSLVPIDNFQNQHIEDILFNHMGNLIITGGDRQFEIWAIPSD